MIPLEIVLAAARTFGAPFSIRDLTRQFQHLGAEAPSQETIAAIASELRNQGVLCSAAVPGGEIWWTDTFARAHLSSETEAFRQASVIPAPSVVTAPAPSNGARKTHLSGQMSDALRQRLARKRSAAAISPRPGSSSPSAKSSASSRVSAELALKKAQKSMQDLGSRRKILEGVRANAGDASLIDTLIEKWTMASQEVLATLQRLHPTDVTLADLATQLHVDPRLLRIDKDDPDSFV
jgi:hypothetical protein